MTTVELWSDYECNGGVALGAMPIVSGSWSTNVAGDDQCEFVVYAAGRVVPALRLVVRVEPDAGDVQEYRIAFIGRVNRDNTRTLRGLSPLADLSTAGLVRDLTGKSYRTGGLGARYTRAAFLTQIILPNAAADGLAWWSAGTADASALVHIPGPATPSSRMTWLKALQASTGDEIRHRRNGAAGYFLDIVPKIGAGAPVVQIAYGHNLLSLQEDEDDTEHATAITVLGPAQALYEDGLGDNAWVVGTATGPGPFWVPLTDFAGLAGPLAFDGQLNGKALLTRTGTTVAITDSRIVDNAVQVASLTGIVAADLVQIVNDTSATRMIELTNPGAKRLLRVDAANRVRGLRNLARNADFAAATSLVPTLWTIGTNVSPRTYRRDTAVTFSLTGGTAGVPSTALVITAGPSNFILYEGDGVTSGAFNRTVATTVQLDGAGAGTVTLVTSVTLAAGSTITQSAGFLNRRIPLMPADGAASTANALWIPDVNDGTFGSVSGWTSFIPASAWSLRSQTFTVKYVAGVTAYVHAYAEWSARAGAQEIANRDASFAATEIEADTVTRCLPSLMIGNPSTSTRLAYALQTQRILVNSEAHGALSCSAALTADTQVSMQFFGITAYNSGAGRQFYPTLLRTATLWLSGASDSVPPDAPVGDASGGTLLWQKANRELLARQLSVKQVRVSLLDLSQIAGYSITRETLVLGGDIEARDIGLTIRIVGLTYDATNPFGVDVVVDSRPKLLTQFLATS